jgi:hypothetical protein
MIDKRNMTSRQNNTTERKLARDVVIRTLLFFVLISVIFAMIYPVSYLGKFSLYNRLVPGRQRLPYGDDPSKAYNLSLYNLEAMFSAHELDGKPKPQDEFRVIVIGDSSTWGFLLENSQTLTGQINAMQARTPDGRRINTYNLGYPVMSLTKDLLLLSYAMRYQPDLVIWPVTLESFPYDKQLFPPLLGNNPEPVKELIRKFGLRMDPASGEWVEPNFWQRTPFGARRELANLLWLQIYGFLWAATGIDQDIPTDFPSRLEDLPADSKFHNLSPPHLNKSDLAFDVLQAGVNMAGDVPVMIVNEPIFISQGQNSDIRYNFYYPRWAYDDYRQLLGQQCTDQGWRCLDLWNAIPGSEFTNTAVHLSPRGSALFANRLLPAIQQITGER